MTDSTNRYSMPYESLQWTKTCSTETSDKEHHQNINLYGANMSAVAEYSIIF